MIKKYYELSPGEKAKHGDNIHTFVKMDGAYAQWTNEKGEIVIGHHSEYELVDGIYIPYLGKHSDIPKHSS